MFSIFSIQRDYIYEIIYMIFEPKNEDIEKPFYTNPRPWLNSLAYQQFTPEEFNNGHAKEILIEKKIKLLIYHPPRMRTKMIKKLSLFERKSAINTMMEAKKIINLLDT